HAATGLLEPRLRVCRDAVGRAVVDHAGVHDALPARHARGRAGRVNARRGLDAAERVLGGPVLWTGLAGLAAFALAPFAWVLLIAPLLSQWHALGLIDTYQALIYSNFSFTVPFTVWMLVGYFESIPRELEESALMDGCGRFGALCRVVLPLAAPGVAATAIFAFVSSWSELLFAITFTSQTEMRTLSAGLLFMVGQYEIQWGQLSAGVIISTLPVAVLFTFLQRHLIRGLTAGALKG